MSFDPDTDQEEQTSRVEELLQELINEMRRVAALLEVLADTEITTEDVEEG